MSLSNLPRSSLGIQDTIIADGPVLQSIATKTKIANIPTVSSEVNPVSWQSVYWAVMAVALNLLLQNAGSVGGFSAKARIALRSSPLVCVADTVLCLSKVILMVILGHSPRAAAKQTWIDRFDSPRDAQSAAISSAWRLNMLAFLLGALPQGIKVFAIQGIPGSHSLTAIFLAAFAVQGILRLTAGSADSTSEHTDRMSLRAKEYFNVVQQWLTTGMVHLQVLLCFWVLSHLFPGMVDPNEITHFPPKYIQPALLQVITGYAAYVPLGHVVGLVPTVMMALVVKFGTPALQRGLDRFVQDQRSQKKVKIIAFIAVRAFTAVLTYFIWFHWIVRSDLVLSGDHGAAFLSTSCVALVSYLIYRVMLGRRLAPISRKIFGMDGSEMEFPSIFFLALNFVSFCVYYSSVFDPEGTNQPKWTSVLG